MTSYENQFQEAENQRRIGEEKRKREEQRDEEQAKKARRTARLNKNRMVYQIIEQHDSEIRQILDAYYNVHFAAYCYDAEVSLRACENIRQVVDKS